MNYDDYVEKKLAQSFEDAHTRHLRDKVESSLSGVAYGTTVYSLAAARKELDKISGVKVTRTGLGIFQPIDNKAIKPQSENTNDIQPKTPSKS